MSGFQASEQQLPLLYSLATLSDQTKSTLLKRLRTLQCRTDSGRLLDADSLGQQLETLHKQGLLLKLPPPQKQIGDRYRLTPNLRCTVLLHLRQSRILDSWLERLATTLSPQAWNGPALEHLQWGMWSSLLRDDAYAVEDCLGALSAMLDLNQCNQTHPLSLLLSNEPGQKLYESLGQPLRMLLLETRLFWDNQCPGEATRVYELALQQLDPSPLLRQQITQQALYRGDWTAFERYGTDSILLPLLQPLLRGNPQLTLECLQEWMTVVRKQTRKRKVEQPSPINVLHALALIGQGDRYTELKQLARQESKGFSASCFRIVEHMLNQAANGHQHHDIHPPTDLPGLEGLLSALCLYWQDSAHANGDSWCKHLQQHRDQLSARGYHWLAAEYDALIARQFGLTRQLPDLHREQGLTPLLELYQRKESWQYALEALGRLKAPPASETVAPRQARLIWLLDLDHYYQSLEPREQRLGARGQWSKGKAVALKRLRDETDSLDFLQEQDRQVAQLIQASSAYYGGTHYELPVGPALLRLVGHPALFRRDAPDVRIDLVAGQPCLNLRAEQDGIHLRLEPEGIEQASEHFTQWETPTRLQVYPVTRELRQIADIVGEGLRVPSAAKGKLVEAVSAIAPLLPIHSDLPGLAGSVEEIAADTRLYAHLLPLAEGLRLQLLVRPLAEGGWFRPGHGSERLLGEVEGRTVQAVRDLKSEHNTLQQALDACPGLARADSDGQEWHLEQPQDALQVLSELQALDGEHLQCVWPEGERMRLKGRSGLQQLKLGLKQQGDWFQLQGSITLDDGKVLQLRQLLELLQASPGRFLKLGENDWLSIGDSLRKRLDELAHLAERVNDDGLRLSPLTAPMLASLADEVGEFKAGADWQAHLDRLESLRHYQPQLPSTLQAELRDYQQEGFTWLARLAQWGVGACLADDMGLGKTVQTLALLLHRATLGPQLVVAPTSVALNWKAESHRFAPTLQLRDYHRQRSLDALGPRDLVIVSYGLLQQDSEAFAAIRWSSVVLDEAQAIKNAQSKRSQAAMALQSDFRLVATGTPLENHLGELWNLFRFINPGLLGSQDSFAQRFANPIENGDAGARRALKQLIQPFILRRLKSQVLDELPARTEITYKVPLSDDEAHQYEALRQQAVDKLVNAGDEEGQALQVLAEITRLRRFCCHPSLVLPGSPLLGSKLRAFQQIVTELLDNRHKALVFSQFVDHLAIVRAWLERQGIAYQYLDGSTPPKARQAAVEAFQSGEGEVFLISLKAGGSGLNLTAADYVIHLDPWWNPAVEDQASDRAHRMGQQRPVTIYRLVTENTIEEQIVALHGRKRDLADSLLDGGDMSGKLDADALLQLLRGK